MVLGDEVPWLRSLYGPFTNCIHLTMEEFSEHYFGVSHNGNSSLTSKPFSEDKEYFLARNQVENCLGDCYPFEEALYDWINTKVIVSDYGVKAA